MYVTKKCKLFKISFEKKMQCKFMAKFNFFLKNLRPYLKKTVLSQAFVMFSLLSFRMEHQKSYWKRNTSVLLSASLILPFFVNFWAILLRCGLGSSILSIFFRGVEVCLERCDSYGNFGLKKSNIIIFRRIKKKEHTVLLL